MKRNRRSRRRRGSIVKRVVRRGVAGGTVTLATLGLTNCDNGGGGVVDPPPPPVVCSQVDQGQNLVGEGVVQDTTLSVTLHMTRVVDVDTLTVSNAVGARFDSLRVVQRGTIQLDFTLDTNATAQVTFNLAGTYALQAGPCDFSRHFTVTIDNGAVTVAEHRERLPLAPARDVRIALLEREGLRVRLQALGAHEGTPTWSVTAGSLETEGRSGVVWRLPAERGVYQIELLVDRGDRGLGFDALSVEVS